MEYSLVRIFSTNVFGTVFARITHPRSSNKENHMPIASTDDPRETPVIPQWESPTFIEVHMDAEIGSYQADEDERD